MAMRADRRTNAPTCDQIRWTTTTRRPVTEVKRTTTTTACSMCATSRSPERGSVDADGEGRATLRAKRRTMGSQCRQLRVAANGPNRQRRRRDRRRCDRTTTMTVSATDDNAWREPTQTHTEASAGRCLRHRATTMGRRRGDPLRGHTRRHDRRPATVSIPALTAPDRAVSVPKPRAVPECGVIHRPSPPSGPHTTPSGRRS